MTTNAALAAQVTSALTRWNDQLDQLADWLTGSPTGGPNADGHYPLTNAEGETELFKSLPYVLDLVTGPADAASVAQAAAEAAETLAGHHKTAAELAQTQAELARDSAQNLRNETEQFRQDVAAYWAAVGAWQSQVSIDAAAAAQSEANALAHADDAIFARDEALVAQNAAQVARDEAQSYAASINPANLATKAELQTELDALVGAAPGTLDTLNEIAAALGDDPNFATTMTNSLAGKSDIGHSHVIADVTGLQTALDGKQPVGSYAQLAHSHVISEVSGLQAALDGKQAAGSYAAASHSHIIGDVTGLQTALDAKAPLSTPTFTGTLTAPVVSATTRLLTDEWRTSGGNGMKINVGESHTVEAWNLAGEQLYIAAEGGMRVAFSGDNWGASGWAGRREFNVDYNGVAWNGNTVLHAGNYSSYSPTLTGGGASGTWGISITGSSASTTGNAATATKLATARNIALSGDVTGSANFDGSGNISITATVADDSHNHTIANVDGLQTGLDQRLNYYSTPLNNDGTYKAGFEADGRYSVIGVGTNSTSSTNFPTGYGATWSFRPVSGANSSNWHRHFDLHKANGDHAYLFVRGRRASDGAALGWQQIFTDEYHPNADKLTTARTISLTGDVSGSVSFDGSANVSITATVADDSHNHTIANVDGLQTALNGKAASSHTHTTSQITNLSSYTGFDARYYTESEADGRFYRYLGEMGSAVNLDNLKTTGRWHQDSNAQSNGTGYPTARAGLLQVFGDRYKYQTYQTYDGNDSYFRTYYQSWSSWKRLLHSGNYNSFSPTLTGGGASGTWGISITGSSASTTGNAATATRLATARTINGVSFNGTANITIADSTKLPLSGGTVTGSTAFSGGTTTFSSTSDVNFTGTGAKQVTSGPGTIAGATFNNGWLQVGNSTTGWTIDNNELYGTGGNVLGTLTGNLVVNTAVLDLNGGLDVSGNSTLNGAVTVNGGLTASPITTSSTRTRDKLRVWTGSTYTIGMTNGFTFGGLGNDYAMTFQMNDQATRGFWWGDNVHTGAQGAMALTTNGKLTVANSVRVGYGESDTTDPASSGFNLDVNGPISGGGFRLQDGGAAHQFMPAVSGGTFRANANATGAIKIKMPTTGGADMISFWVDIFDYASNETISVFIAGYVYQAVGGNVWHNETAIVLGAIDGVDFTVRFGHDGSDACVYIGEANTVWQYPQITVRDVQAGHSATDPDGWVKGWGISLATSLGTIERTITDTFPMASKAKGITSGAVADGNITRNGQGALVHHGSSSHSSGKITVSTAAPSGGSNGDIWLQV